MSLRPLAHRLAPEVLRATRASVLAALVVIHDNNSGLAGLGIRTVLRITVKGRSVADPLNHQGLVRFVNGIVTVGDKAIWNLHVLEHAAKRRKREAIRALAPVHGRRHREDSPCGNILFNRRTLVVTNGDGYHTDVGAAAVRHVSLKLVKRL